MGSADDAPGELTLVSCRQSNFVISGRGGLPAAPNDLLSNREPVVPWVSSPGASS
ncbi:MAG: hypothetical protein F6K04_25735, partial [Leptolyngbya sp. SIO4C5]|nr:hypothetical protein [Leptolyngbya sp. SIO4C5]